MQWYTINNTGKTDTPALVIYKDRAQQNIEQAIAAVKDPAHLRPHVKTNKIAEVCRMMLDSGITKFKCATIAEADMLASIGAKDVLLAFQPVGPKAERLLELVKHYSETRFSCILDDFAVAKNLSELFSHARKTIYIYIDLNTGMNRTGIRPSAARGLMDDILNLPGLKIEGLHAYDGHLNLPDINERQKQSDLAYHDIDDLRKHLENITGSDVNVVSGGSPTFFSNIKRNVECSPGTFVFWDYGYKKNYPEEPYEYAALVITRVISIVSDEIITTDLGYKSVASESPLPRLHFMNAPEAVQIMQSEEHLTLRVPDNSAFRIGDILYGVPIHICPTVALYEKAWVVNDHFITNSWNVVARNRIINF